MTVNPDAFGYVSPQQYDNVYGNIPVGPESTYGSSSGSQYGRSVTSAAARLDNNVYTSRVPIKSGPNYFGRNGYYYNGPTFAAMSHGNSEINQINALVQSWADPIKRAYLDNFSRLLLDYGHTNSPGVLWALAQSGLDPENETIQQVLAVDAKAFYEEHESRGPKAASSIAAQADAEEGGSFWSPFETFTRNAFAGLSMPLEATQGTIRGIGGALTAEGGPDLGQAFFQAASTVAPPLGFLADAIYGEEFQDPWEQTDFGQTLLAAGNGQGFEAFTKGQAGLDLNRAKAELLELYPELAVQPKDVLRATAEAYAQEKGYYGEPGWFIDETSTVGQAQRQSAFKAWAIPGPNDELTAWTLGRGIFSNIGGTDWEGYGVASGLVDAVASVLLDPTIVGGKLGVPSKLIKFATAGREAGPVLVGAERAKALKVYETSVFQLGKAFDLAQAGELDAARRAAYPVLRDAFDRPPTDKEIDEFLSEPEFFSKATLGRMQIEEIADVVYQAKRGQVTAEAMARSRADMNQAAGLAREARRAYLENTKYNRFLQDETIEDPAILAAAQADTQRVVGLWDEYITNSFDADGRFSAEKFDNWLQTRFPTAAEDEDYFLFQQLGYAYSTALQANPSFTKTAFRDALANQPVDAQAWKQPRQIDPTKVEQDTARLYYDDDLAPDNVQGMIDTDLNGIVLQGVPGRNNGVLGAYNDSGAVFYAPTGAALKVASAAERVADPVITRIRNRVFQIIDDPNMRPIPVDNALMDMDTVPAQVSRKIEQATDIRASLETFFYNSPVITYGGLLDEMAKYGLDVVFDDILRELPKSMRLDGITDIRGIAGRTWIGDSSKVIGYQISDTAREAGIAAREIPDGEAAIASLVGAENVLVGPRATNVAEFAARTAGRGEEAAVNWNRLEGLRRDDMFKAQQEQLALEENLARIDAEWSDPVGRLKSTIGWQAGLRYGPNGVTLDDKGMREFLFGTGPLSLLGSRTLDALSDFIPPAKANELREMGDDLVEARKTDYYADAVGQVRMLSNGKWDAETAKAIVDNAILGGGRNGLIDVLAPRLGVDVTQGTVGRTVRSMPGDGTNRFRTWRDTTPIVKRTIDALTRELPAGRVVSLSDPNDVVGALITYGKSGRLSEEVVAKYIGRVSMAEGTAGMVAANRNALTGLFDEISNNLVEELSKNADFTQIFRGKKGQARKKELLTQMRNSTALYMGGRFKLRNEAVEDVATDTAAVKMVSDDGGNIEFPSIQLETEIAEGFVNLPSVDEWRKAFNRFTLAMQRYEAVGKGWDFAFDLYDDFFRTSLLALRAAYILRNSGEMQFRMFLNGHSSMFNDPLVLTGMVIADGRYAKKVERYNRKFAEVKDRLLIEAGKGGKVTDEQVRAIVGEPPRQSKLAESFNMYADTVLDTKFTTLDKDLAAANHIDDFFALIREANSLTDPRVYKYAARAGWRPVEYGNANFTDGLANELIMLERSKVARLVAGNRSAAYGGALNGPLDETAQRTIAQEFMYSSEFDSVRQQLLSASDEFKRILDDEDAALDFLFLNENSVLNRVIRYTGNDPDLLDYIRTGNLRDGTSLFYPRAVKNPKDKIVQFSSILQKKIDADSALKNHYKGNQVTVPWNDFGAQPKRGIGLFDWFFGVSNKIERLSSVGPEFRMAYWDRVAELAPGVRRSDVGTMWDAAQTTLRPLKRMVGGKAVLIGDNHPAWEALRKARKENSDGLLTAEEIHQLASRHASEVVAGLFYDASRRNNFWYQLRLLTPFGQAYGNTINLWGKLGAKRPIQAYKVAKVMNAVQERDSQAIYELGQELGFYSDVAEGTAPFEQDLNGGFFYSNDYGQTTFMLPLVGKGVSMPLAVWGALNGVDTSGFAVDVQSPAASLNLAFGGESILPGASPFVSYALNAGPSDNEIISKLRDIAAPFGDKDLVSSATASWMQRTAAGASVIPGIGGIVNSALGNILSPGLKGKNLNDAGALLATSGGYANYYNDPKVRQRFKEDSMELAALFSLIQGVTQNISPSSPQFSYGAVFGPTDNRQDMTARQYGITYLSTLYNTAYLPRNGFESGDAKAEIVADFGIGALYAITGNVKGFTRMPRSAALDWARKHPDLAPAWRDTFELFFPGGDIAQTEAVRWLETNGFYNQTYKTPDDIEDEVMSSLKRIQKLHIDAKYANNIISEEQHQQALDDLDERYTLSGSNVLTILDYGAELERFNVFAQLPEVQGSDAAIGFRKAWILRQQALDRVRTGTGDPKAGLGSQDAASVYAKYLADIDTIAQEHPDFKLLAGYFKKEWR